MSQLTTAGFEKLEDSLIWREACALAEYMYGVAHSLKPHDEEYRTESKIKFSANDMMFYVAQALGNAVPTGAQFEWGNARKNLSALKTMYRFAGRQKFLDIDPAIMVRLEKLNQLIEGELNKASGQAREYSQSQLQQWRDQYAIWRKMNRDGLPLTPKRPKV